MASSSEANANNRNTTSPATLASPDLPAVVATVVDKSQMNSSDLLVQILTKMANQTGTPSSGSKTLTHSDFMKLQPPSFEGVVDPSAAENWLEQIEKIFTLLRKDITSEEKVDFATYMLKKEANNWWKSVKARNIDGQAILWENFKHQFLEKYFPENMRFKMERQFLELRQNNLTIAQYEHEFNRLSQYALVFVADEHSKARRFAEGLIPPIRRMVRAMNLKTFREVVETATVLEEEHQRERGGLNSQFKRKENIERPDRPIQKRPTITTPYRNVPNQLKCAKCGLAHKTENCRHGAKVCYRCRQPGHFIANCPTLGQEGGGGQGATPTQTASIQNQGRARFNAATHQGLAENPDVVAGITSSQASSLYTISIPKYCLLIWLLDYTNLHT